MSMMFAFEGADLFALPAGTKLLNGLYEIVEPLQEGGFAMTYVARDSLERHVVIKECFPAGLCTRHEGQVRARTEDLHDKFESLKKEFLREARGVATLKHPYIVNVYQVFEENNTAYMALEYVAGMDLISVLEQEPERLTAAFIDAALRETLKAVRHIHANGVIHRDIAPDNIRVDAAGRITLIDFGASRPRDLNSTSIDKAISAIKEGYSPPEFYAPDEDQEFSSDLYSVAATFHHLITGEAPVDGLARKQAILAGQPDPYMPLTSGDWDFGNHILASIDQALDVTKSLRPQTADNWLALLDELPREKARRPVLVLTTTPLQAAISTMVRDVNETLETATTALNAARVKSVDLQAAKPKRKQWFDVVGNPIADLNDWALQQELLREAEIAAAAAALVVPDEVEILPEVDEVPVELPLAPEPPLCATASKKPFFASLFPLFAPRRPKAC
ncbi:MAG: serine/threonine-protein kinase [bacterium]